MRNTKPGSATVQVLRKIGFNIKKIREERQMSQSELAYTCRKSQATISSIESGKYNLTVQTLVEITGALGCGFIELFN